MWPRVKHYLKIYPIVEGVKKGSVLAAFEAVNKKVNSLKAEIMLRFFILLKIPAYTTPHTPLRTPYTTFPAFLF
jgi:hypothetical protein